MAKRLLSLNLSSTILGNMILPRIGQISIKGKKMKNVNTLLAKRNRIEAEIISLEKGLVEANHQLFVEEVLNLFDCVGEGFVESDYYAPSRYYSNIRGVKNIRLNALGIQVKVTSPAGYLLPEKIEVHGEVYPVHFVKASSFSEVVDY